MPLRFDEPLPPRFDPAFYRAAHPDLDLPDDAAAAAHYAERGQAAGLVAVSFARREALVAAIDVDRPALEIGPFCQPLLRGPAVEYLDRLNAEGLRARAEALGLPTAACPARIHHLGGLGEVAPDRFDAVLASHAIEHQPDLVRHLGEVARVLRANGRYHLVVPDKRFCFDHFLPASTIADVLDAFNEERRTHRLGSVVEHVALVTHNDPVRHWRGDHGGVDAAERRRRTVEALAAHRRSDGGYVDVHAWQFTPDSFAELLDMLARLGLSAFEVERVYDTPRDRAEFCAVLRRARPAAGGARRDGGLEVRLIQTADPFRYARMLAVTQPNVVEYARRHGLRYQSFVGLKRGRWSWQATFNRIPLLGELVDAGARGWAVYLDADAYVRDLDFDLAAYLATHGDRAAILATSGMSDARWDVNAGVVMVNLDHPRGRDLVRAWEAELAALSDEQLREHREWDGGDNDQDMLHRILRDRPEIAEAVRVESMDLINSAHARFIRQRLRAQFEGFEKRVSALRDEVAAVAAAFGVAADVAPPAPGGRAAAQLLHHVEAEPWLAEAPAGCANERAADRALAHWRGGSKPPAVAQQDEAFVAALEAGDRAALAGIVAELGRAPVARGLLGGDRQHRRATDDRAFARERALRTHDALLSLAELAGGVPIESPDGGTWGVTRRLGAPALFAAAEKALSVDLAPPPTIGSYLGVEVGERRVLHLRMIEAIHLADRARQVAALLGLPRVTELGGGIGLSAWYAHALGLRTYRLAMPAVAGALAAAVLAPLDPAIAIGERVDAAMDLVVGEDIAAAPAEWAIARLREAADAGARALLSVHREATVDPVVEAPLDAVLGQAGGWRRVSRARHGIKPGYVEELFLRAG